jgi:hypothetical protein
LSATRLHSREIGNLPLLDDYLKAFLSLGSSNTVLNLLLIFLDERPLIDPLKLLALDIVKLVVSFKSS